VVVGPDFLKARYRSVAARTKNNAMHAVSVAVRQYANGVNKGTLSANVAKVEAKEKELAAAKAAAKVLLIPIAFLPHYHPSITPARAHCFLQGFCAKEMGVPDWPRAKREYFLGGRGERIRPGTCQAKVEDSIVSPRTWKS